MSVWKWLGSVEIGVSGQSVIQGSGSPEGVVSAVQGSIFMRSDGGVGTSVYIKESGSGNTGWTGINSTGGGGGGTPGGSDTQIQFNQAGSFGASSVFYYDYADGIVKAGPNVSTGPIFGTANVAPVQISTGSSIVAAAANLVASANLVLVDAPTRSFSKTTSIPNFGGALALVSNSGLTMMRSWSPTIPCTNFTLTSVDNASSGNTVYHGIITGAGTNVYIGALFAISGFANPLNNGGFICTANTGTTLTLANASGVSAGPTTATATVANFAMIGVNIGILVNPTNGLDLSNTYVSCVDGTISFAQGCSLNGQYYCFSAESIPAIGAGQTINISDLRGFYSESLLGDGSTAATYNISKHVGLSASGMGFRANASGTVTDSWGVNIEGPRLNGVGILTRRYGIRIADQVQGNTGGTNSNAWGILETSTVEKNALGSINLGGSSGPLVSSGTGSPEGVVTSVVGGVYLRTDGVVGTIAYLKSSGSGNTGWLAIGSPYNIAYFLGDTGIPPNSNQKLLTHVVPGNLTSVSFPNTLSGSYVGCLTAPTSNFTITIKKSGTTVGTMTIGAGLTAGTFSFSGPVTTSPGDIWDFVAPSVTDGTVSGIYFVISGTRS